VFSHHQPHFSNPFSPFFIQTTLLLSIQSQFILIRGIGCSFLFRRGAQNKRYNKFKHLHFGEDRAFQSGKYAISGIQEELER